MLRNDEIIINYVKLKNDIAKLKRVSKTLDRYSVVDSSFDKSKGAAKNALDDELETIYKAGITLQDAINQMVDELENIAKTFKETDDLLASIF